MRNYLLAGAAIVALGTSLPLAARADTPVTVTLGGRVFESLFIQSASGQNDGASPTLQDYNFQDYFRLYPAVDYTAPDGIHYGFKAEVRWHGNAGASYLDRAYLFVKSDKFGTFRWGGQDGALEEAAVANDEASGTGGWDGEYGFFGTQGGVKWLMADTVSDGTDGVMYKSPSFAGFGAIVSFIPDSGAQIGTDVFVNKAAAGSTSAVKNRVEGSLTYSGTFSSVGVNANVGGATGSAEASGFKDLSVFDAGLEVTVAGFTVGGHVDTGKFAGGFAALPTGASGSTTAYDAGVIYTIAGVQVGAQYYGFNIPFVGGKEKFSGESVGAKYVLNPGVTLFLDALFGEKTDTGLAKTNYTGVGLGTYFQW